MALKTVLTTLAGISLAADMSVVINPNITDQPTVPKLQSVLYTPLSQREARSSVQFRSAKVAEVLSWLQTNRFNFVITDGEVPNNRSVTLNVVNQPISSVADAVASALGGHWEQVGAIHVFKKGSTNSNWMRVPVESNFIWGDGFPKPNVNQDKEMESLFGPGFEKKMQDQFGPKFQKKMQEQFGPEFQKKMQEQFGPEFQKKMQEQFGPEFQKKMQDQFGPKFQKRMQEQFGPEFQKKMQDSGSPELKKQMEEQFGPKFQKQMEEMGTRIQKQMEEQFGPQYQKQMEEQFGPKFEKRMEEQFGPKFQKQMEDMSAQIQKEMERKGKTNPGDDHTRLFIHKDPSGKAGGRTLFSFGGNEFDVTKLLNSLTPAEKDQQKKQGYIWYNDLTREQRALFGQLDGKFDIDLKLNGEEIRVRRN